MPGEGVCCDWGGFAFRKMANDSMAATIMPRYA